MGEATEKFSNTQSEKIEQMLDYMQTSVLVLLGAVIIGMVCITCMSAVGVLPWLQIDARLGSADIPAFGPAVQVLFTVFCVALLTFLPSSARVLKLERTHREFSLTLDDLERAYRCAHAEDRKGNFTLSEEFNAVRERMIFLKRHPDMAHLEPEILEVAAQMSYLSRDLATVYSDDAITRAKSFLKQRQADIASHNDKIEAAVSTAKELRRWVDDVDAEELQAKRQIARLEADLQEILPKIGYAVETQGATVLPMTKPKTKLRETVEG